MTEYKQQIPLFGPNYSNSQKVQIICDKIASQSAMYSAMEMVPSLVMSAWSNTAHSARNKLW